MTVFAPDFWSEFEKVDREICFVPEIVENPFHAPQPRPKQDAFAEARAARRAYFPATALLFAAVLLFCS
jgi:hypothetical protein